MGNTQDKKLDSIGINGQAKLNGQTEYVCLVGAQYNLTEPTLTDGQRAYLQLNSKGHLKVDTELSLTGDVYVDNVKTFATDITDPTTQGYGLIDSAGVISSNIAKVAGTATAVNTGNVSDGVQRITIADDDTNLSAINTAVTSLETKDFATETTLASVKTATETTATNSGLINTSVGLIKTALDSVLALFTDVVDTSSNLVRVAEQDPLPYHLISEVLDNLTNGTDGTYTKYFNPRTFKYNGIRIAGNGGSGSITATIEATMQDDGTAAASCVYSDVTLDIFGSSSFVITSASILDLLDNTGKMMFYKYVKVNYVLDTSGANDADVKIERTGVY